MKNILKLKLKGFVLLTLLTLPVAGAFAQTSDVSNPPNSPASAMSVSNAMGDVDASSDIRVPDRRAALNFFTPKQGDLSVALLGRIFGTVGNILPGGGNQILGALIGIFNTAWVAAIGLGVFWIVSTSVVAAAGSGEMMAGKGKKTVFHTIRIVVGFALVVPSATTGYSLAQTATMWIAVQGVGMASRVYERFHQFISVSGSVVPGKPPAIEDLEKVLPMSVAVVQSATCMYKLQDLMAAESKEEMRTALEAEKEVGTFSDVVVALPSQRPTVPMDRVGYGLNDDNTVTFGTRKTGEPGYQYNDECGRIDIGQYTKDQFPELVQFVEDAKRGGPAEINVLMLARQTGKPQYERFYSVAGGTTDTRGGRYGTLTVGEIDKVFKQVMTYQRLGTLEVINQLKPAARKIASADIAGLRQNDPQKVLEDLKQSSGMAMGASVGVFATILDPLRTYFADTDEARKARLKEMEKLGWLYTPLAMLDAARPTNEMRRISDFLPGVRIYDAPRIRGLINAENKKTLETAVSISASPEYRDIALAHIKAIVEHQNLGRGPLVIPSQDKASGASSGGGFIGTITKAITKVSYSSSTARRLETVGITKQTIDNVSQAGPAGPIILIAIGKTLADNMKLLQEQVLDRNNHDDAMRRLVTLGGSMIHTSIDNGLSMSGESLSVTTPISLVAYTLGAVATLAPMNFFTAGLAGLKIPADMMKGAVEMIERVYGFYITFALIFVAGGSLLYFFLPLVPVLAFFSMVINWFSMILINILGAPIFCFNLIRSDGEGMVGRGEKYIADIIRTMVTPAVLTIGMVAFLIMFDAVFALLGSIFTMFIPILAGMYKGGSAYLGVITAAIILLSFSTIMLYLAQTLATLCSAHAVRTVGGMIGETVHNIAENMPHQEAKSAISSGASQAKATGKGMTSASSGAGEEKQMGSGH